MTVVVPDDLGCLLDDWAATRTMTVFVDAAAKRTYRRARREMLLDGEPVRVTIEAGDYSKARRLDWAPGDDRP